MSGDRKKLPPLPMPRLISVAEEARLRAAGEWPPPDPPAAPRSGKRGEAPETAPDLSGLVPASIAAFYERLLDTPPWLERTARTEDADKARAERARERHHLARWPKGRDG